MISGFSTDLQQALPIQDAGGGPIMSWTA